MAILKNVRIADGKLEPLADALVNEEVNTRRKLAYLTPEQWKLLQPQELRLTIGDLAAVASFSDCML